jgi:ABC-type sulfate transport system permease component
MSKTASFMAVNRQQGRSASAAATLTGFTTGFLRSLLALGSLVLLAALSAVAQSTATVTLFTDTNSTDGSGNPD